MCAKVCVSARVCAKVCVSARVNVLPQTVPASSVSLDSLAFLVTRSATPVTASHYIVHATQSHATPHTALPPLRCRAVRVHVARSRQSASGSRTEAPDCVVAVPITHTHTHTTRECESVWKTVRRESESNGEREGPIDKRTSLTKLGRRNQKNSNESDFFKAFH